MTNWRHFRRSLYREALIHIQAGGIAVHDSGMEWAGKKTAHLLASSMEGLFEAAAKVSLAKKYLQMTPKPHFDLFGGPLKRAMKLCSQEIKEKAS